MQLLAVPGTTGSVKMLNSTYYVPYNEERPIGTQFTVNSSVCVCHIFKRFAAKMAVSGLTYSPSHDTIIQEPRQKNACVLLCKVK